MALGDLAPNPRRLVELVVFISGTSDMDHLAAEAVSVIDSLDKVLCPPLGITLRPVRGTTDARAGTGRPQSRINPLVDGCHLFIGLYGRRIGTPTGVAESGTREELERALERRQGGSGAPEVLIFFRTVSRTERADPGPQLEGVLRLREDLRNQLLWIEYHGRSDFRKRLLEQLIQWVLELVPIVPAEVGSPVEDTAVRITGGPRGE